MTEASQNTPTVFSLNDVALRANKLILETEETPGDHRLFFIEDSEGDCTLFMCLGSQFCTHDPFDTNFRPWWANESGIKALGLPDYFMYANHGHFDFALECFEMQASSPQDAMNKLDALENAVPDGSGTSQLDRVQYCIRDMYHMLRFRQFLPDAHPEHQKEVDAWEAANKPEIITSEFIDASSAVFKRLLETTPRYQDWYDYAEQLESLPLAQALRALKEPEERYAETAAVMRGDIARRYPLLKGELGFREVCQP
ncbi:MAG: hypothetical protein PHW63_01485 [Alphaproteobacteria bacterium]|nr:hypothetical protein [Alphaproteobacteria bacterium]